jgi:MFS transporter, MHS family, citrate/tricarballylate:H+ symporter
MLSIFKCDGSTKLIGSRWIPASAGMTIGGRVPESISERPPLTRGQIASVAAGNALEFYDFVTYSFFATQIGRNLFPGDAAHSLIYSLSTFGVGFLTHPLGGILIGRMADRRGRKPAMILSFTMIGVALVGLALTPSYAAIGGAAPVLAVIFRLIQGFALGGEVGPNVAYLLEAAPPNRRAFYVSLNFATADFAVVVAGLIGFGLSSWLSPAALDAWGWRIAFLIGASIVPFGVRLRRTLVETLPEQSSADVEHSSIRPFLLIAFAGVLILGAGTVGNYTLDYLTTYAQATLHMAVPTAFAATVILGAVSVAGDLSGGWLSDRFGPKRVLVVPWLLLLVLAVPAFGFLSANRTAGALLGTTTALTILHIMGSTPALLLFVQAIPARIRAGAMGFLYAFAIALFGGTTQLFETALIRWTGNPVAPAWYMTAAVVAGLIGAMLIGEPRRNQRSP